MPGAETERQGEVGGGGSSRDATVSRGMTRGLSPGLEWLGTAPDRATSLPFSVSHKAPHTGLGPWAPGSWLSQFANAGIDMAFGGEGGGIPDGTASTGEEHSWGIKTTSTKEGGAAAVLRAAGERQLDLSASGWDQPVGGRQAARIDLLRGLQVLSGLPSVAKHGRAARGNPLLVLTDEPSLWVPGGLTAVIYTDALQTVIMVGGALVLMFLGKVET